MDGLSYQIGIWYHPYDESLEIHTLIKLIFKESIA